MAELVEELHLTVTNRIGELATLATKIRDAGVDIIAIVAWEEGDKGHLLTVTENNDRASAALGGEAEDIEKRQVVLAKMPNRVGALGELAGKLAEAEIDIQHIYASTGGVGEVVAILSTSDNEKAVEMI